jgi:hypothetical protein
MRVAKQIFKEANRRRLLHHCYVIDERYEQMRQTRRRVERIVFRTIAIALAALAIASIVAAFLPGSETYDGTELVDHSRAGSGEYCVTAAISIALLGFGWLWPRPRTFVLVGVMYWVAAVSVFIATFTSSHHGAEPRLFTYVNHRLAQQIAGDLMVAVLITWFVLPIAALAYGLIAVAVDDHVRRKLPPAPEFPVARVL